MVEAFRVGLLLTERCNIHCSHCWLDPTENVKQDMALEEARRYIDQASEIPSMEWISLTGGEPFLLPELMLGVVGHASSMGLRTECVTNCAWADSMEDAEKTLEALKDVGLEVVNISSDDFHQEHVPFGNVANCFEAARGLGLKIVIMSAARRNGSLGVDEIAQRLGEDDIKILGRETSQPPSFSALAVETGFVPAGRGASLPREEWLIEGSPVEGPCNLVLRDVGVDPRGNVLQCCSAASILDNAKLGNASEEKLKDILERANRSPLYKDLRERGPANIAEELGVEIEGRFVSKCHLCHEVMGYPGLDEVLG